MICLYASKAPLETRSAKGDAAAVPFTIASTAMLLADYETLAMQQADWTKRPLERDAVTVSWRRPGCAAPDVAMGQEETWKIG